MSRRQMIYNSDGDLKEANNLVTGTLDKILKACNNGSVDQFKTILNSLESEQLSRYLNAMINSDIAEHRIYLTPLMIASVHGQDSIVRFLLKNYSDYCIVDAQNYSSDYDYDYDFYNETNSTLAFITMRTFKRCSNSHITWQSKYES